MSGCTKSSKWTRDKLCQGPSRGLQIIAWIQIISYSMWTWLTIYALQNRKVPLVDHPPEFSENVILVILGLSMGITGILSAFLLHYGAISRISSYLSKWIFFSILSFFCVTCGSMYIIWCDLQFFNDGAYRIVYCVSLLGIGMSVVCGLSSVSSYKESFLQEQGRTAEMDKILDELFEEEDEDVEEYSRLTKSKVEKKTKNNYFEI